MGKYANSSGCNPDGVVRGMALMLHQMPAGMSTCTAGKGVTMQKQVLLTTVGGSLILLALLLSGCYTQLATTEGEEDYARETAYADDAPYVADSTAARGYTEYRERVYFDYYYPSFAFSVGYYSPWAWGVNWWYTPYWTPYYYGYGWYAPIAYPGWYYPSYGYPYYPYATPYASAPYATRTHGNTRTAVYGRSAGTTRDVSGAGYAGGSMIDNMGRAAVRSGGGGSARGLSSGVRTPSVPNRLSPTTIPRTSSGGRSPGSVRASDSRSSEKYRPGRSTTPSYNSGNGSTGRSDGDRTPSYGPQSRGGGESRSGGGQSYSPPASRPSSPPPSSGGGQGGGSRGGNRR